MTGSQRKLLCGLVVLSNMFRAQALANFSALFKSLCVQIFVVGAAVVVCVCGAFSCSSTVFVAELAVLSLILSAFCCR